jgi:glyoxylase-like metal-dependent hydrolase (beta-lactamase superfamily II)
MSVRLGEYRLDVVSDGTFRLDGGAMFGVVPRVLWERVYPPDERNRIRLGLNCLLVRTGRETVLVDTGIGDKWSDRERDMYGVAHETTVPESLAALGLSVEDVDVVVCTHLHFDHAGGNTRRDADGNVVATFPRARYVVQSGELETARAPHERERASYMPENWEPLVASGQLETVDGEVEIVPGIRVFPVRGHNDFTQLVEVESGGERAVYFADIIPTTRHLRPAWLMGYDLYPVELLERKKELLARAVDERWACVFEHDHETPIARIERDERGNPVAKEITEESGVRNQESGSEIRLP